VPKSAQPPDAQVKPAGHPQIELEITMALDRDSKLYPDLWKRRRKVPRACNS
jgi:hypothetical protein